MLSLAVKNLKMSLDALKQSFLFSGDSTWPPRDKGLWPLKLDRIKELFIPCFRAELYAKPAVLHACSAWMTQSPTSPTTHFSAL